MGGMLQGDLDLLFLSTAESPSYEVTYICKISRVAQILKIIWETCSTNLPQRFLESNSSYRSKPVP